MADVGIAHAIGSALLYIAKKCDVAVWCDDATVYAYLYEQFAKTEKLDMKAKQALGRKISLFKPDLIVTSLSNPRQNGFEDIVINVARTQGIKSVGILDKVLYSDEALDKILVQRVLPEYFIVASDMMRLKLQMKIGAIENVFVLSMPKFSYYACAQTLNGVFNTALRSLNGIKTGEFPLIFLSSHSEYDQRLIAYLSYILGKCKDVKLLVSFHPKEDEAFRQDVLQRLPDAKQLDVGYCSTILALKALTQNNKGAVCSFSSPLLFDVASIGGTAISLLTDVKTKCVEPLAEMKLALLVDSRQQFVTAIKAIKSGEYRQNLTGFANVNAINQFVQAIYLLVA